MANENDTPARPGSDPNVPRGTTPTWEIEMLLSGAVVFALMQVPGRIDVAFDRMFLKLDGTLGIVALLVYCYAKTIVYSLVLTFLAHLAARAYWIALVGLDSVYPDGPKWQTRKMGAIARETLAAEHVPLRRLIGQADDRCSLIFASGILLVLYAVFSLVATAAMSAVVYVVSRVLFGGEYVTEGMLVAAIVLAVPSLVLTLVDRLRGDRVERGSRLWRLIAAMNRMGYRTPVLRTSMPLLMTLSSNKPTQRAYTLLFVALMATLFFVMGEVLVRREVLKFDMFAHLPDQPTSYALDPDHYEDRREAGSAAMLPYIQSEIVAGPYLRLFVPYLSERHEAGLARVCPDLEPLSQRRFGFARRERLDDARSLETLACFERMLAVELDGAPAEIALSFGSDARTGHRGVVAMIGIATLGPGRHVLALRRPDRRRDEPVNLAVDEQPASGEASGASSGTPVGRTGLRYEIPFWR